MDQGHGSSGQALVWQAQGPQVQASLLPKIKLLALSTNNW
jgi:hypothetical protein